MVIWAFEQAMMGHLSAGSWVVIDEVQRVPALLTEVHALYERRKLQFALTGSSARKLRRGGADMLAGRALQREMFPLVFPEIPSAGLFNHRLQWARCLAWSQIPNMQWAVWPRTLRRTCATRSWKRAWCGALSPSHASWLSPEP